MEKPLYFLDSGSEHLVYFDPVDGIVLKTTREGIFGDYYELVDGVVHEFRCTPAQYLLRLMLLQKQFGFSQEVVGVTELRQIVSYQTFVVGDPPTQPEVDSFLLAGGLIPIKKNCWLWKGEKVGGAETWIGDARADNFVSTPSGIVPIDLRMWEVVYP